MKQTRTNKKMILLRTTAIAILSVSATIMISCGGGGGETSSELSNNKIINNEKTNPQTTSIPLTGSAVKGPIAHAVVTLYPLQHDYPGGYDPNQSITTGYTDAFANITDVNIPMDTPPPFVLIVQSDKGIDLNTGKTPILTTLINVITKAMLVSGEPVYITPLTTMIYYMALNEPGTTNSKFVEQLSKSENNLKENLGVEVSTSVNFLTSPPVLNDATNSIDSQQQVAEHRAAIEMLAALLFNMSTADDKATNAKIHDEILKQLALDLQSDGVIDARAKTQDLALIDTRILKQNPSQLRVPNTNIKLNEITTLLQNDSNYLNTKITLKSSQYTVRFKPTIIINSNPTDNKTEKPNDTEKTPPTDTTTNKNAIPTEQTLQLSWDPNPRAVDGYLIFAGVTPDVAMLQIADINLTNGLLELQNPNITLKTQTDLALKPGDIICFRVKAYKLTDHSEFSDAICTVI